MDADDTYSELLHGAGGEESDDEYYSGESDSDGDDDGYDDYDDNSGSDDDNGTVLPEDMPRYIPNFCTDDGHMGHSAGYRKSANPSRSASFDDVIKSLAMCPFAVRIHTELEKMSSDYHDAVTMYHFTRIERYPKGYVRPGNKSYLLIPIFIIFGIGELYSLITKEHMESHWDRMEKTHEMWQRADDSRNEEDVVKLFEFVSNYRERDLAELGKHMLDGLNAVARKELDPGASAGGAMEEIDGFKGKFQ